MKLKEGAFLERLDDVTLTLSVEVRGDFCRADDTCPQDYLDNLVITAPALGGKPITHLLSDEETQGIVDTVITELQG